MWKLSLNRFGLWSISIAVLFSAPATLASCPVLVPLAVEASAAQPDLRSFVLDPSALTSFPSPDLSRESLPLLTEYRDWARVHAVSVDPIDLLKHQRAVYARVLPQELPRFDALIEGRVGTIQDASCLEAGLLEEHLKFGYSEKRDTECVAYVMDCGPELRIRFQTSSTAGVSPSKVIQAQVQLDRTQGCKLVVHLHNHPFDFENHYGDISGTVIPSGADMDTYRNIRERSGLEEARITNGFNTLRLDSAEFSAL